ARPLSLSGDSLESRQLMTALINGGLEQENNNSAATANDFGLESMDDWITSYAEGAIGGKDSQDFFRLTLNQNVVDATFGIYDMTGDLNLQIRNSAGRVLASGLQAGLADEEVTIASLPAGVYYIRVFRARVSVRSTYTACFDCTISQSSRPTVGDVESNDSRNQAGSVGVLVPGIATIVPGRLGAIDRVDYYRVPVAMNGTLEASVTGMQTGSYLSVEDVDGNFLAIVAETESVTLTGLPAGDYFVSLIRGDGDEPISYQLSTTVTPGGPVNSADSQPNDTRAAAIDLGTIRSGGSFTCLGRLTAGDADWYRFETTRTWDGSLAFLHPSDAPREDALSGMQAGVYYVRIDSDGSSRATLMLWDFATSTA
ncbi:MAG: hypothetical protein EBU88_19665, partial [Acidobacteria bacterium]|nr:hypothetical protein [Acidobacteriota bacterium]